MMNTRLLLIIILSLCIIILPINVYCEECVYVGGDKFSHATWYYINSSVIIDNQNKIIGVWAVCMANHDAKREVRWGRNDRFTSYNDIWPNKEYWHTKYYYEFDYKNWKMRKTRGVAYDYKLKIMSDRSYSEEWESVEDDSVQESLLKDILIKHEIKRIDWKVSE